MAAQALLATGVCCAAVYAPPVSARLPAGFEQIHSYEVDLVVEPDGDLRVQETIDYDFGAQSRRGIYRDIPVRFRFDDTHDRVYPLRDVEVRASRGAPADTDVSDIDGGRKRIRVGDEDTYITGRHTYVISYVVAGAINRFSDHDELFWNAIGPEWEVPIAKASARVRTPTSVSRVACYAGELGSVLGCSRATKDGSTATFTSSALQRKEGLTVVVGLAPGSIANAGPILKERWSLDRAFERSGVAVVGALGLLAAGVGGVASLVWRRGRDRRWVGEVPGLEPPPNVTGMDAPRALFADRAGPVEYAPPAGMTPALMGVLIDERADALDVTASIVDLAVRRHLRIDELPRKGWFGKRDWRLTRLTDTDDPLLPWESQLLGALFRSGSTVELSDLKNTFHTDLAELKEALYADVVRQGWFARQPDSVRTVWHGVGIVAAAAGAGVTYLLARYTHLGLLGLPLVVSGLLLLVMGRHMPSRTPKGSAALARALGFRRYLATAEAAQLRFEEQEGVFARYLPYAVVLGEVERWAQAFGDLGGRAQQELYWYSGPDGWSSAHFADSMTSFASSTSSTMASTPSSSGGSGFSGGGSSGGGGGGGGGGSW
jgi:uncharacterized protein (TIGR04222 family)